MCTLVLALLMSALGFRAGVGRAAPRSGSVLAVHLFLVAAATLALQLLGAVFGSVALSALAGAWIANLAVIHSAQALSIGLSGAPLHRQVLKFALFNVRELSGALPRRLRFAAAGAPVAIVGLFALGMLASSADLYWDALPPVWLGGGGVMLATFAAALVARLRRLTLDWDPVCGLLSVRDQPGIHVPPFVAALAVETVAVLPTRRPTVVIFVIDSLRASNLPFHGYHRRTTPFLSSWIAQRGARAVPVAVSNCVSSECGAWSLLTSRRYRHLAVNAVGLHGALRRGGYKVRFFLSGIHCGWMGLELLYGAAQDTLIDKCTDTGLIAETAKLPPRSSGGDFLYYHLMSAHTAAQVEPYFERWKPTAVRTFENANIDSATREAVVNHYDNSVLQADDHVRAICSLLEKKGYLRDAIVIVTADHGESLGDRPGELLGHCRNLFQESIHIPFVVMDTACPLPEVALLADQTDVAATIAHLTGFTPPTSWQGQSIFRPPFRQDALVEFVTHPWSLSGGRRRHMQAVLSRLPSGLYKAVRHRQPGLAEFRAAFCLTSDPGENRSIDDVALLAELEARRRGLLRPAHEDAARAR